MKAHRAGETRTPCRGGGLPAFLTAVLQALALVAPAGVAAEVATLHPVRDNTLFEDAEGDTSNGAGPVLFVGNNSQLNTRRAVLLFDIASSVAAGAIVDSVRFTVEVSNSSPGASPSPVTVHRVTQDWGEGSSSATGGSGAPATDGDATWLHTFYPGAFWNMPGGDFEAAPLATVNLADVGSYSWSGPNLTASVQAWLDNAGSNYGWLLKGNEAAASTARRLESREAASESSRPTLVIYYRSGISTRYASWGQVKNHWRAR